MPTLSDIRNQYPEYRDLSDSKLADALYSKFYSDMPREQFNQRVGFSPTAASAQEQQPSTLEKVATYQFWPERLARAAARGVVSAVETGAELTKKALTGQYGPTGEGLREEDPGKILSAASPGVSAAPEAAEGLGAIAELTSKAGKLREALPTKDEIKSSAQAAYKAIADARLIAHEGSINDLVSATRAGLDDRLIPPESAPRAYKAVEQLQASGGDISQILSVRQRLGEIKPDAGEDFAAAQHIRDAIDDYVENLKPTDVVSGGDPAYTAALIKHARSSWRSYAQLDQIDSALKIGQHRAAVAGTGANTQNALRQRIREILDSAKKSRGFSAEAKAQMEDIVMGTKATNAARFAGKYAPSGPVSSMATGAAYFAGHGGIEGALIAAGVAIPATVAKYLGTWLTKRQIAELENIVRAESPLGRAAAGEVKRQPASAAARGMETIAPYLPPTGAATLTNDDVQGMVGP